MSIKDEVRTLLINLFYAGGNVDFDDDQSLLDSGEIDSLDMMDLVSGIEKKFNFKVDVDDLLPENFDSVNKITEFVQSRLG